MLAWRPADAISIVSKAQLTLSFTMMMMLMMMMMHYRASWSDRSDGSRRIRRTHWRSGIAGIPRSGWTEGQGRSGRTAGRHGRPGLDWIHWSRGTGRTTRDPWTGRTCRWHRDARRSRRRWKCRTHRITGQRWSVFYLLILFRTFWVSSSIVAQRKVQRP